MPERYNDQFWGFLDRLVAGSEVVIDQPAGSPHTDYPDSIYPLDYGYLAGTTSADGSGIDVWVGAAGGKTPAGILVTVDLIKRDSEIKVLLGCSEAEMLTIVEFQNTTDNMHSLLIRRGQE